MTSRFILPLADIGRGITPFDGAKLFFFAVGTSNKKATFSNQAGKTPNDNPVIANGNGVFPEIWITGSYKVVLKTKNNKQIWEEDPVIDVGVIPASSVTYLAPWTGAKETTLRAKNGDAVSILDFDIRPDGDLLGGGTDNQTEMQKALDAATSNNIPLDLATSEGTGIITVLGALTYSDNQIIIGSSYENCVIDGRHTGNVLSPSDPNGLYRGLRFQDFQITKSANAGTGSGLHISNSRSGIVERVEVNSCDIGIDFDTKADANFSYMNSFIDNIVFNNTTNALRLKSTGTDIPNANFIVGGDYRGGVDVIRLETGENIILDHPSIQAADVNWLNSDVNFTGLGCRFENSASAILTNSGVTLAEGASASFVGGTMTKGVIIGDVTTSGMRIEGVYPELNREKAARNQDSAFQKAAFRSGVLGNLLLKSNNATAVSSWPKGGTITLTRDATDTRKVGNNAVTVNFDATGGATSNYSQDITDNSIEGRFSYTFAIEAEALTGEGGSLEVRIKQIDSGLNVIETIKTKILLTDDWATHSANIRFALATPVGGLIEMGIFSVADGGDLANAIVGDHSFVIGNIPGVLTTNNVITTGEKLGVFIGPDANGNSTIVSEEGTITTTTATTTDGVMAVSDGTTGGSGSAGAGNQFVELDIGGIVHKVLTDGTV